MHCNYDGTDAMFLYFYTNIHLQMKTDMLFQNMNYHRGDPRVDRQLTTGP